MAFELELAQRIRDIQRELNDLKTLDPGASRAYVDALRDGWMEIPDGSWSYASATTITVPAGAAGIYSKGDQIRFKQGGDYKYFYLRTVENTLLTIVGSSDYTLVSSAITDASFSKGGGVGFPGWFVYEAIVTAGSGTLTSYSRDISMYHISGRCMTVILNILITNAGSGGGGLNVTLPLPLSNTHGYGREDALTGNMLQSRGSPTIAIFTYNNGSPIATNARILQTIVGRTP